MHFSWVPAHVDVEGNDRADEVAKAAAVRPANACPSLLRTCSPPSAVPSSVLGKLNERVWWPPQ